MFKRAAKFGFRRGVAYVHGSKPEPQKPHSQTPAEKKYLSGDTRFVPACTTCRTKLSSIDSRCMKCGKPATIVHYYKFFIGGYAKQKGKKEPKTRKTYKYEVTLLIPMKNETTCKRRLGVWEIRSDHKVKLIKKLRSDDKEWNEARAVQFKKIKGGKITTHKLNKVKLARRLARKIKHK